MPKITSEITRISKMDQAIQVWSLLQQFPKMTQKKACEQVGIDPGTYRKWIAESSEAIEVFQKATIQIKRLELQKILVAREHALDQLIKDAISPFTDAAVRLMILQWFTQQTEILMGDVHAKDTSAADFLTGPTLKKAESRFSSSEADITITIHPKQDILDITPKDNDNDAMAIEDRSQ